MSKNDVKKRCRICGKLKLIKDFAKAIRNTPGKYGVSGKCLECCNNPELLAKRLLTIKKYRQSEIGRKKRSIERKGDANKNHLYKKRYKITLHEYRELLKLQNNKCAICEVDQADLSVALAVDHCHGTGKVRGLLCLKCNSGLGLFKESLETLEKAKTYIVRATSTD